MELSFKCSWKVKVLFITKKKSLMYACVEASVTNVFQLINFGHKIISGGLQLRVSLFASLIYLLDYIACFLLQVYFKLVVN